MGADIHMYVEYRNKKHSEEDIKNGRKPYWYSFVETNPGRNYTMFAVLAGVRGNYKDSFEPKGKIDFDDMGHSSRSDAYLYISENKNLEGSCTLEDAKRWAEYGRKIIEKEGKPVWIEHPDWHSHSWMSVDELEKAYAIYEKHATTEWETEVRVGVEYRAILAAMKEIESCGEYESRVVFWFDN